MSKIEARLAELGIILPTAQPPVAAYIPFVKSGALLSVSGQLPMREGKLPFTGKLGAGVSDADGIACARQCFLNILAHVKRACDGDLDRVVQVVRLGGFIACTPEFSQHPNIMNGASELSVAVFGDAGRHTRSTVGVPSLPFDAPVEVEGLFEIA